MKLKSSISLLALVLSAGSIHAEHYKIYLIGGQSNAAGRGDAGELSDLDPFYDTAQTNVAFYWHSTLTGTINGNLTTDTWVYLQPDSGEGKNSPAGHAVEFGPELAFGRTMAEANPAENIAIIKYAHGGSNLHTQWAETGDMYATFLSTVNEALTSLTASGHTYQVVGMLWQQGEADTGSPHADNYEANLTELIARVRADLFGGLSLPFVVGGLSSNQYSTISDISTGAGKVRLAQETVSQNVDGVGFANADTCEVYDGYAIHFNATGQLALGAAHATEMLRLEALDTDYDGLAGEQETLQGTDPDNPDSDGDGQKDGFEYRAGTLPLDPTSFFKVHSIGMGSNRVTLNWPSKDGNAYRVEQSTNLVDWAEIDDHVTAQAGSNTVWTGTIVEEGTAPGNILARYDAESGINGNFNTTGFDSSDTEPGTTASRLQQGGSLNGGGKNAFVLSHTLFNTSASGPSGFNLAGSATASRSTAAAVGDWFAFTVDPQGSTVDYTGLSFYSDQYGNGGQVDVSYTIGSTETFVLQNYVMPQGNVSVALNEIDFADFSSSGNVTWTFYLYGAAADNYGNRFDDITLYGSSDAAATEENEPSAGFYRVNLK